MQEGTSQLNAAEADRLSRLRAMLADAQSRVGDQSALGQHLAIVGIDGVGELAIGMCAHKRGVYRRDKPLPATLSRLLGDLSVHDVPGVQGFSELHDARNQAQHQGILPAADQLPRWVDETAALVAFLVQRCFGIDLTTVGSATAVKDQRLATTLGEAEEALEAGETTRTFELSWKAVQDGLTVFRHHTRLGGTTMRRSFGREFQDLGALEDEIASISRQLELSLFASEAGEWMWFEQRHDESNRGLEPSIGEARRGFVFALGWALRMESYVARHGPDRWERWHELRAPVTGLPGGPHISDVSPGKSLPGDEAEWVFQLTDVPDHENPDFTWAVYAASTGSDGLPFSHAHLDPAGKLVVRTSGKVPAEEVADSTRQLIASAKQVLEVRWAEDEEEAVTREELAKPFEEALAEAGLPVKELGVRPSDRGTGPLVVWIELADVGTRGKSWFGKCLEECFDEHLEGHQRQKCRMGFADVVVPADWPAKEVIAWMAQAREMANAKDRAESEQAASKRGCGPGGRGFESRRSPLRKPCQLGPSEACS